jgi:hypothetical protein
MVRHWSQEGVKERKGNPTTETGSCIVGKGQNRLTFFTLCNYGTAFGCMCCISAFWVSDVGRLSVCLHVSAHHEGYVYCKIWEHTANVYQGSC